MHIPPTRGALSRKSKQARMKRLLGSREWAWEDHARGKATNPRALPPETPAPQPVPPPKIGDSSAPQKRENVKRLNKSTLRAPKSTGPALDLERGLFSKRAELPLSLCRWAPRAERHRDTTSKVAHQVREKGTAPSQTVEASLPIHL